MIESRHDGIRSIPKIRCTTQADTLRGAAGSVTFDP